MAKDDLVFDVGSADFEERVIRASHHLPVAVDFWASWCTPCRVLGPVLERVVLSFEGKVHLAKLDIDENMALASRWGIRSIPAVIIFRRGEPAGSFVGAQPEAEVRRVISSIMPTQADDLVGQANRLAGDGSLEEAESSYRKVLELEPGHPRASIGLAGLLLERGDRRGAGVVAGAVSRNAKEYAEAQSILRRIEFTDRCETKGGREVCERRAAELPGDPEAVYDLACCLVSEGDHRGALDSFLRAVEIDKEYGDGVAKDAMLTVFSIVGERSDLAEDYRDRLAQALY